MTTTPTDQQLIETIAKWEGWTNIDIYMGHEPIPFTKSYLGGTNDGCPEVKPLPDYLNDHNPIRAAVGKLSDEQWLHFKSHLEDITESKGVISGLTGIRYKDSRKFFNATPHQLSLALFRVIEAL